jgi:hypothetical protein
MNKIVIEFMSFKLNLEAGNAATLVLSVAALLATAIVYGFA